MKTRQEIKDMINNIMFTTKKEANEVTRFLNGIGIQPKPTNEHMFSRNTCTACTFIEWATSHVFSNEIPLETIVDLGIQIYNLCSPPVENDCPVLSSKETGIVMIGDRMGLCRNGYTHVCSEPASVTVLLDKMCRETEFVVLDHTGDPEIGKCYQVTIHRSTEDLFTGTYYMMYLGNQYWLSENDVYYDIVKIPDVDIRALKEK